MKTFDKKDVYSWNNAEEAKTYIGKTGYFNNDFESIKRAIELGGPAVLDRVDTNSIWCFKALGVSLCFGLFLPADKVKEVEEPKQYRPFKSTDEFLNQYKVGQVIHLRIKKNNLEQLTSIVAVFIRCYCCLRLGVDNSALSFEDLFNEYEININGNWQPFGVAEE